MIDIVIEQRRRDLGGFEVGRVLPYAKRHMVGPFIFFDHMGPVDFPPGIPRSVDVRPHPHIGLSTVTYLFDGEIMHRDSLATEQAIRPGEVNWMTAGRGITHSERFIEWHFVSSSKERIEQAKSDWRAGRMKLPDLDNGECIQLPGDPAPPANPVS